MILSIAAVSLRQQSKCLVVSNWLTGEEYARVDIHPGDEVSFQWEHSFEHIPWYEYYEVTQEEHFLLHTIAVAGFGAGIPAEMDCEYRYEDGLVYMDGIESEFPQFNWINSHTALKKISVNQELLLTGADMPHHEKIEMKIE